MDLVHLGEPASSWRPAELITAWWYRRRATCSPWGCGEHGCLGHKCEQDRLAPLRLGREQFGGEKIVFVNAGGLNTVALAEGGGLWVWCLGHYGQLGLGDRDNRLVPTGLGAGEVFGGSLA